jgi:hypothetical protein
MGNNRGEGEEGGEEKEVGEEEAYMITRGGGWGGGGVVNKLPAAHTRRGQQISSRAHTLHVTARTT